jgi:hypothetical protein
MVWRAVAGYDSRVAGLDEAQARSTLADMQDRLTRGPMVALGITPASTPEDARAAFLQLTKVYHPVRFGRMAADIQKQANEVFLALRAAHDTVAKTLRRPSPVPGALAATPAGNGRPAQNLPGRPAERPVAAPIAAAGTGPRPATGRPGAPAGAPPAAPATPSSGPARTPGTARPAGSGAPVTARDEAAVIDLIQRQQWDQARSALHQLSARDPSSKRIRALECYARGREAQLDRRLDDARVELQDALDLDPDLQVAKTALTELFTRRK